MIISHRHRFVFFAVPKTATHTIRRALAEHLGSEDWEQQDLFARHRLPIPEIAAIQHGHISADQVKPYLPAEVWDDYFKFAFVRNPFDRYVSACFFLQRNNPAFSSHARTFMKQAIQRPRFQQRVLVKPQSKLLAMPDGKSAMDFIGRYESLQDSYDEICRRVGIASARLGQKNQSKHGAADQYYDDELRGLVGKFYADDFRLFGYGLDSSACSNGPD